MDFEQITGGIPVHEDNKRIVLITPNMTLRDWFAGQTLAGYMADSEMNDTFSSIAMRCYKAADAMLKEREETR